MQLFLRMRRRREDQLIQVILAQESHKSTDDWNSQLGNRLNPSSSLRARWRDFLTVGRRLPGITSEMPINCDDSQKFRNVRFATPETTMSMSSVIGQYRDANQLLFVVSKRLFLGSITIRSPGRMP